MLPIHNSTFDLSTHPWYEPLERASELAAQQGVNLLTPVIGAPVSLTQPTASFAWWRALDSEEALAAATADACGETC